MGVRGGVGALVAVGLLAAPSTSLSQVLPFDVPLEEHAPRIVGSSVRVVVVGTPDPRITRLSAQRLSSRRRGEARARQVVHRWVDDALSRAQTSARVASLAHAAVDAHATVVGRRPLAAGGTVVVLEVPLARLRAAAPLSGVPWAR